MSEASLIRQGVAEVNALMGSRDVIVDVTLAATDGGWGGSGTGETVYVDSGRGGGGTYYDFDKKREWPVVLVRRVLTKDEENIDVIVLEINGLKV